MERLLVLLSLSLAIASLSEAILQLNRNHERQGEESSEHFAGDLPSFQNVDSNTNPPQPTNTFNQPFHHNLQPFYPTTTQAPSTNMPSLNCIHLCRNSQETKCRDKCGGFQNEEESERENATSNKDNSPNTTSIPQQQQQQQQRIIQLHKQQQQQQNDQQQKSYQNKQQQQQNFIQQRQQPRFLQQQKQQQLLYQQLLLLKRSQLSAGKREAEHQDPFVNVEGTLRSARDGQLDAVVSWELKEDLRGSTKPLFFVVFMARETCNLHDGYPHCEETDRMLQRYVKSYSLKGSAVFKSLNYNSKYWLEVAYAGSRSHRVWLNTAPCRSLHNNNFTICLDNSSLPSEPNYLAYKSGSWLKPDIVCRHHDKTTDTAYVWLDWTRFNSPSQVEETTQPSQVEETIGDTTGVAKMFAVSDAVNSSAVENVVLVTFKIKNVFHSQFYHPLFQKICLLVRPDVVYDVKIKSRVKDHDIIFDHLFLNVSRDLPHNHTCASMFQKLHGKQQDYWTYYIIALALTIVIIVILSTSSLIFCGRCRKAHTKLLKKTLLAKNNSYKTAPGASVLYMKEERAQTKDEWELDAREVTLGAEIGQGAFGLVMTGYYRECQVAIKVLKGDVSPSYRDELLREIQLMKNIGSHSNIVSLVGSCTLKDPIALIMEYMPFGNLQLFLQKCCMEGEVQKTDNGAEVSYCPTDNLTGVKEILCISSTDLLSFARQVALAMEFITNKRYVHRDLAARNVLVTTNKVVKLCDFGLARIVCNGDQYCKLTNGRLPLKWMALESIKDRIFTVQSDVWSFGVFLWEITTFGSTPYPDVALVDLYRLLSEGYRMSKPQNCSHELYHLMTCCWLEDAQKRPSFSSVRQQLEMMLAQKENYLDLDHLPSSLPHPKRPSTPCES